LGCGGIGGGTFRTAATGRSVSALMYKCKARARQLEKAGDDERKGYAAELTNC